MSVLLLWVIRILVVLIVLRFVLRAVAGRRPQGRRAQQRLGGTLVRDPQCGTYLPPARALAVSHRGEVLHFCSDRCRDAWATAQRHGVA